MEKMDHTLVIDRARSAGASLPSRNRRARERRIRLASLAGEICKLQALADSKAAELAALLAEIETEGGATNE